MSRYFAQLNNQGIVERVIVADFLEWCVQNLDGDWVETFMNDPRKNYAGKGHKYEADRNNFIPKKPFESWTLNADFKWVPPVEEPKDGKVRDWDEDKKEWVENKKMKLK